MKATELMIGDWIFYGDKPVKVLQLSENSKYDWVKPIPITYEILKKNGWKETEYWHEYEDGNTIIQYSLSNIWGIINGIEIEHFKCEYVHQLQHLLRLCELDELVDNFKVQVQT